MENKNKQTEEEKEEEAQKAEEEKKKAEDTVKRIEDANKKTEELLDRSEALAAKQSLGGGSEGGTRTPKETEDEKWAREAKIRYEGTGLDPT